MDMREVHMAQTREKARDSMKMMILWVEMVIAKALMGLTVEKDQISAALMIQEKAPSTEMIWTFLEETDQAKKTRISEVSAWLIHVAYEELMILQTQISMEMKTQLETPIIEEALMILVLIPGKAPT
jgi:hypothetical protein